MKSLSKFFTALVRQVSIFFAHPVAYLSLLLFLLLVAFVTVPFSEDAEALGTPMGGIGAAGAAASLTRRPVQPDPLSRIPLETQSIGAGATLYMVRFSDGTRCVAMSTMGAALACDWSAR